MKTISTHEAKTHLSRYLTAVEASGEEFIIAKGNRPVARLVPLGTDRRPPRPRVGEMVSEPGEVPEQAIRALTDAELAEWGLR